MKHSTTRVKPPSLVLSTLVAVVLLDQAAKWWAWRHVGGAIINNGGDQLVGPVIGRWYTEAIPGALLDLLDAGLIVLSVALLLRRPRPVAVLLTGGLMISGWCSNLLDRLGLHSLTAPGSARGAVDFILIGSNVFNVADFVILGATPLFLVAVLVGQLRGRRAPAPSTATARGRGYRNRQLARLGALAAAAGLVAVVGVGAARSQGTTSAETTSYAAVMHADHASHVRPWRWSATSTP